jgi:hypothetical protein
MELLLAASREGKDVRKNLNFAKNAVKVFKVRGNPFRTTA